MDLPTPRSARGRGARANPTARFERLQYDFSEADSRDGTDGEERIRTLYLRDPARSLVTWNRSPDVPFEASINPYRGCEHGCIYCYARPGHEYLGLSAGLDFETRIFVKEQAPELLRRELCSPRWQPQIVALSGVTDPYQPIERHLGLTRRCLEVLAELRNPVAIITKSGLVARDVDLLGELARHDAVRVSVSITTLDARLQRAMEPRAAHPRERLRAIEKLAAAGIPVGVMVAPVIPGLSDHELPAIVAAAAAAGARHAGHIVLRLPHGVADLFEEWLAREQPLRAKKVLSRVRALRGGRLDDPRFGSRMRGEGPFAEQIGALFELACRRAGLPREHPPLSTAAFRRPTAPQLELFV